MELPHFRTDLVSETVDDGGRMFIDVTDPDSGDTFRFYDVEYAIACAMNGERDVNGLARWAQEELGLAPSAEELQGVISTLGDLGYLQSGSAAPASVISSSAAPMDIGDVALGASGKSDVDRGDRAVLAILIAAEIIQRQLQRFLNPVGVPVPERPLVLGLGGGGGAQCFVQVFRLAAPFLEGLSLETEFKIARVAVNTDIGLDFGDDFSDLVPEPADAVSRRSGRASLPRT